MTPEKEWTLVACGLIAHADDVLEVGEWDQVLRMVDDVLEGDDESTWLDLLADRGALERRFAELSPPDAATHESILRACWQMALSDGHGSDVEAEVHDRIAERLGLDIDRADEWRKQWTVEAGRRAELVASFAAIMANLDGRMDSTEAVEFDALLERLPLSVGRRMELAANLHSPPAMDVVVEGFSALPLDERKLALEELAPLIYASARGDREREALLELAGRMGVAADEAEHILDR